MSDWLSALGATADVPDGLSAFAATQPSLAETWKNAPRGDWLVWMAAHSLGGKAEPRDVADAAVVLADFLPAPTWRRMFRLAAAPEDVLRRLVAGAFDIGQIVAHVYLGSLLGTLAGLAAYAALAGHNLILREAAGALSLAAVCSVVTVLAQLVWRRSAARAASRLDVDRVVPLALQVAAAANARASSLRQLDGARIVRKRLDGPVASTGAP